MSLVAPDFWVQYKVKSTLEQVPVNWDNLPLAIWKMINEYVGWVSILTLEELDRWASTNIPMMSVVLDVTFLKSELTTNRSKFLQQASGLDISKSENTPGFVVKCLVESSTNLTQVNSSNRVRCMGLLNALVGSHCVHTLTLRNVHLGAISAKTLGDALGEESTLRNLDLSGSKIRDGDMSKILCGFNRNRMLRVLLLNSINLGVLASTVYEHLANIIEFHPSLVTLSLQNTKLTLEKAALLLKMVESNTVLKRLDLSASGIGPGCGEYIRRVFERNTSLRTLCLDKTGILPLDISEMTRGLCENQSLMGLSLAYNIVGSEGGVALARAVETNTALEVLNLSFTGLGTVGGCAILKSMLQNHQLSELNLCGAGLTCDCSRMIANVLQANTTLTNLDLSSNSLGPDSGDIIGTALRTNQTLTALNLTFNHLGGVGVHGIARGIEFNQSLRWLSLSTNGLGAKGAKSVANAISHQRSLRELNLQFNPIGPVGAKALAQAMSSTKLTTLLLRKNDVGSIGAQAFVDVLKQVPIL
eukprot:CAMPEP_0203743814 /NCGR_PEP_ID=MMETSP0098-20131031/93_1 /ASSEMBLY_ACC=CAM_ASM_000208 /TAXON_ID=96639 /ORGANISM=" , Strain NY0313808BC1" /LENGTH=530 /DNA_ID=CAMNT_0050631149 /DNA_START=4946 /DNA_END=6538 /DNA_ORIENTATION=+